MMWCAAYGLAVLWTALAPPLVDQRLQLHPGQQLLRTVQLQPDQALQLHVQEQNVDVEVRLLLAGRDVLGSDGDVLRRGMHQLVVRMPEPTTTLVLIKANRPGRVAGHVQLSQRRQGLDDLLHAAELVLDLQETELFQQAADPARAKSAALLQQVEELLLARASGSIEAQARAVFMLDKLLRLHGQHERAIDLLSRMEQHFAAAGQPALQAQALNNLGMLHRSMGSALQAGETLQRALELKADLEPLLHATIQGNVCLLQIGRVRSADAIDCNQQVLLLSQQSGDYARISRAFNNLGGAYAESGDYANAMQVQRDNVELLEAQRFDGVLLGNALANLGLSQQRVGQLELARSLYDRAHKVYAEHGLQAGIAQVMSYEAQLQQVLGDAAGAYQRMQEVVRLRRELGMPVELVQDLLRLSDMQSLRGQPQAALAILDEALSLTGPQSQPLLRVDLLQRRALVRLQQQQIEAARAELEAASELADTLDSEDRQLTTRMVRARLAQASGQHEQALQWAGPACVQMAEAGWRLSAAEACGLAGRMALKLDDHALAAEHLQRGLTQAEKVRAELLEGLDRVRWSAARRHLHEAQLNALLEPLLGAGLQPDVALLQRSLQLADAARARVLREQRSGADGGGGLPAVDLSRVQRQLEPDVTVLFWLMTPPRTYVWLLQRDQLQLVGLPGADQLQVQVDAELKYLRGGFSLAQQVQATNRLCDVLWAPLAARLSASGRVALISDGVLGTVPWAALRCVESAVDAGATRAELLHRYEFSLLPSLAALRPRSSAPAVRAELGMLAVVDPEFPQHAAALEGDPLLRSGDARVYRRLPGTVLEAQALQALQPQRRMQLIRGRAATVPALLEALQQDHALVHIGTHGLADVEHASMTGLVLLDHSSSLPQLLSVPRIFNSKVSSDLVVLASCDSASGSTQRGEGVLGVGYAFLAAGAQRVLASAWPVDDGRASVLLKDFYHYLLVEQLSPAAALRRAQMDRLDDPRTRLPQDWAVFALLDAQLGVLALPGE